MKELTLTEAIRDRRTIRMLSEMNEVIELATIYDLLEKASYAPFHSKKEPWEVTLVSEEEERLFFVEQLMKSYDRLNVWENYDPEIMESAKQKTADYFANVPVTLIVSAPIEKDEKKDLEAISAVSAFIQNFQLLAWEQQIGVTWRTTVNIFDRQFAENMGLSEDRQIIGLLFLTSINEATKIPPARRKSVDQWTSHLKETIEKK
ncbi:nitroreductase family protein [Enterococcus sp. LJL99]